MRSGQALVLVLLVVGIASVVGLSVVSRSISDVSVSTTEDQSFKALEAAEAGIEQGLGKSAVSASGAITSFTGDLAHANDPATATKPKYQVQSGNIRSTSGAYEVPYLLDAGNTATLVTTGMSGGSSVCVRWSVGSNIATTVYSQSGASVAVNKNLLGSGSCATAVNYPNAAAVTLPANSKILRVRVVNNATPSKLMFESANLPDQGVSLTSTGQYGETSQRIVVKQPFADLPMMFDSALFSGGKLE